MWQRNQVEAVPRAFHPKFTANYFLQFCAVDELHDSQSPDGNDETRPQDFDLVVHPRGAIANFVRSRHSVAAAGILARKTSTDSGKINCRSYGSFVQSTELLEPTKHRFTGGVRERSLQNRLTRAGCLANQHHIAKDRAARNRRRLHARAAPALQEMSDMVVETDLFSCHGDRFKKWSTSKDRQ